MFLFLMYTHFGMRSHAQKCAVLSISSRLFGDRGGQTVYQLHTGTQWLRWVGYNGWCARKLLYLTKKTVHRADTYYKETARLAVKRP